MSESNPTGSRFATSICQALQALYTDTDHVAVRRYEDEGSAELVNRLPPIVLELVGRASEVMATVLEHYESQADDTFVESTEGEFEPLARPDLESPRIAVADVAFMAITELRQHRLRLTAHQATMAAQEIVSSCGSALRAIKKSLYAIEPVLCELEQHAEILPPRLQTSLAVRRHYHKLWTFASGIGTVNDQSVRAALRGAGTRIAILVGNDVYDLLREDDRFRIRDLQTRILAWLGSSEDPAAALRIWQDFALFVEMLRQINLREELVDHDRDVLRRAITALRQPSAVASPSLLDELCTLKGVDDELDRVLQTQPGAPALLRAVERVARGLQLHTEEAHDLFASDSTSVAS